MLAFLVYLMLVAAALGQKRCCVDKQFSAVMSETSKIAQGDYLFSNLAEDFEAKLLASHTFRFSPGNSSIPVSRVVQDFNKGVQYIITDNNCIAQKLEYTMQGPCIPDDAEYLGVNYIGFQPNTINMSGYRWKFANQDAYIVMGFSDDCVPLIESIVGTVSGAQLDSTYVFNGYQRNIPDRSIFNIPSNCTFA